MNILAFCYFAGWLSLWALYSHYQLGYTLYDMDKKDREKSILKMVYNNDQIDEIIDCEKPDFKVRNKHQQAFFGVEVTELYYSESNARLRNIPNYLGGILDNRQYRHKEDMKALEVHEFTLLSDDKPDQQFKGILKELPPVSQYVQIVIGIIKNKSKRIQQYIQDLTHVNLIILDTENRIITFPRSDFYRSFFTPYLQTVLCKSGFREVFFVTKLETDRWVYIPLKMLFLVSELYVFDGVLQHYYPQLNLGSPKEELSLFAYYLYHIGAKGIHIVDTTNEFEVIYGNCGIILTDDKKLIVRDYADYPLPEHALPLAGEDKRAIINDAFETNVSEFVQHNTFVADLAFDANSLI